VVSSRRQPRILLGSLKMLGCSVQTPKAGSASSGVNQGISSNVVYPGAPPGNISTCRS
jgi:hypothetical protein